MSTATTQDLWVEGHAGRLFVRSWSPAPQHSDIPLVIFHDSLGCVELWRGFPAALSIATGRRVIAYDRLGFGRSDPYPGKLPPDFIAREATTGFATMRQQLGIDAFVVFGHSVGGGMAINCAARFGSACVAVVTESAQAFIEDRTIQGIEAARRTFMEAGQTKRLEKYHGDKAEWVLDAWIGTWLDPAFATWSLQPVLPEVRCPILAIHGVDDEFGSLRHPELIRQFAAGTTRVHAMADTGHVPHREREQIVLTTVAGFLK